ncbi:MAG TPA: hypothetical protein VIX91_07765, partial [Candidatus Acidoferrum sp.]
ADFIVNRAFVSVDDYQRSRSPNPGRSGPPKTTFDIMEMRTDRLSGRDEAQACHLTANWPSDR